MPLRTRLAPVLLAVGFLAALTLGLATSSPRRVEPLVAPPAGTPADGIDTSSYQHVGRRRIDWTAVRHSGISYALIKATEGSTLDDPWFERDWKAAATAGLYRGAYHYARPADGTAAGDAAHFLEVVGPLDGREDLPPVLDLEQDGGLDPDALAGWVSTWIDTVVQGSGRRPIIYTGTHFWTDRMAGTDRFADSPLWYAHHTDAEAPGPMFGGWTTWTLWQWSDSGSVPGISPVVDLDRLQGGGPALEALAAARTT